MTILDWLLDPSGLTPHGFCLSWEPGLIALHAESDAAIGLAYIAIPGALLSLVGRRKDLTFNWMIYLFVAFIVTCGLTHLAGDPDALGAGLWDRGTYQVRYCGDISRHCHSFVAAASQVGRSAVPGQTSPSYSPVGRE